MKNLFRSTTDKYLAGLFGGLGETYAIDPNILRLAAVFAGIATGILPLVVTYLVAWFVVPQRPPVDK
ncbi:MAG: PspC domain-containing protein [Pirellulaceae bacterium]